MKKIIEMLKDSKFWFFVMVVILFFGIFIKMDYATDTYCVFGTPASQMIQHFIYSGRFVTAFSQWVLTICNCGNEVAYTLSVTLAFICTAVAIYKIFKIFEDDIKLNIIAIIVSIMIIINLFSIELYLFLEKGILMFSVLLCVLAFEKIVEFFKGKNKKKSLILAFIYMLIANFSYQGTVALFVALSLIYILKYSKNFKEFITNNIVTAICYGIPALINYMIVKFVFANSRVNAEYNIIESIYKIMLNTKDMFINTYKIIPQYVFISVLTFISLISVLCFLMKKNTLKNKAYKIFGLFYIIIGTFVVTIFPQIMQSTEAIGFAPRSTYAFASLIGIITAYTFINADINKIIERLMTFVLIIYISLQFINFENIARDRYIVNYMDYNQFLQIQEIVEKYEEETDNFISKIAVYKKDGAEKTYPGVFINGDINIKAMCPDWSRIDYLEYYFNRCFVEVESSDEIYDKYFKDKQWNYFNEHQIVLIDDTMHIYIY